MKGEPTSAPGAGDTMRTAYGAGTSSAGLRTQLATRPPMPPSAATAPAIRIALRRTAKTASAPPKMSRASPHCTGNGRLLRMCAITGVTGSGRRDREEDRRCHVAGAERIVVLPDELRVHRVLDPGFHADLLLQRVAHVDELVVQVEVHVTF